MVLFSTIQILWWEFLLNFYKLAGKSVAGSYDSIDSMFGNGDHYNTNVATVICIITRGKCTNSLWDLVGHFDCCHHVNKMYLKFLTEKENFLPNHAIHVIWCSIWNLNGTLQYQAKARDQPLKVTTKISRLHVAHAPCLMTQWHACPAQVTREPQFTKGSGAHI